ncbi:MAG: DNA-directed RNA polymerase subunit B'' [Candidatus Micrarchaeia archaeon]
MRDLLESYVESNSPVKQQIDSYNRFLSTGLKKLIESQEIIEPNVANFSIKLKGIRITQPILIEADSSTRALLPNEALQRDLTYSAPVYLSYVPLIQGIPKNSSEDEIFIGELPIMVKSDLCYTSHMTREQLIEEGEDPDDPGGYFIIKGTERVLIGVEDLAPNRIITTKEKNRGVVSKVFSTTDTFRSKCSVVRDDYGIYTVIFPTISKGIDLILILHALDMTNEEILNTVKDDKEVYNDFILNIDISKARDLDEDAAIIELGKLSAPNQAKEYQQKRAIQQIDSFILPHIGIEKKDRRDKALFLIEMAKRTTLVNYGILKQDDKDHYANKRVKLAGDLMSDLFAYAFKFFVRDIKYHIERMVARGRRLNFRTTINPDTLTERILSAMGTGTWPAGQTGVSQVLERVNYASTLAHLRRIKSPLVKKRQHFRARDVHGTQIGKICPSETPEGPDVGLTKYLAIMARVTVGADKDLLLQSINKIQSSNDTMLLSTEEEEI